MQFSKAIESFLFAKQIQGLSPNTIRNYRLTMERFHQHFDNDPIVQDITAHDLRSFLHHLQKTIPEVKNLSIPRQLKPLSPKSIRNIHGTLSSFWEWLIREEIVPENIVRKIKAPNPKLPTIKPFDEQDIRDILKHANRSSEPKIRLRDKAIILFLLDTGVRVSELCNLRYQHIDLVQGTAIVQGKGRVLCKKPIQAFGSNKIERLIKKEANLLATN